MAKLAFVTRRQAGSHSGSAVGEFIHVALRLIVGLAIALFILLAVYNTLAGPAPGDHDTNQPLPGAYFESYHSHLAA